MVAGCSAIEKVLLRLRLDGIIVRRKSSANEIDYSTNEMNKKLFVTLLVHLTSFNESIISST